MPCRLQCRVGQYSSLDAFFRAKDSLPAIHRGGFLLVYPASVPRLSAATYLELAQRVRSSGLTLEFTPRAHGVELLPPVVT